MLFKLLFTRYKIFQTLKLNINWTYILKKRKYNKSAISSSLKAVKSKTRSKYYTHQTGVSKRLFKKKIGFGTHENHKILKSCAASPKIYSAFRQRKNYKEDSLKIISNAKENLV